MSNQYVPDFPGKPGPKGVQIDPNKVYELAKSGLRKNQVISALGITTTTYHKYARAFPELEAALNRGMMEAVESIEHVLWSIVHNKEEKTSDRVNAANTWMRYNPKVHTRASEELIQFLDSLDSRELDELHKQLERPSRLQNLEPLDSNQQAETS